MLNFRHIIVCFYYYSGTDGALKRGASLGPLRVGWRHAGNHDAARRTTQGVCQHLPDKLTRLDKADSTEETQRDLAYSFCMTHAQQAVHMILFGESMEGDIMERV